MNKGTLLTLFLLSVAISGFSEELDSRLGLEAYRQQLFDIIETTDNQQQEHEKLIEAAELLQLSGDLNGAAGLFKRASLAQKGKKDFESLYRASVLNVETDFLREAEADLRAIIMFSEDPNLRLKAGVLTARIKKLQNNEDEAKRLLTDILLASDEIPLEAFRFAGELLSEKELADILNKKGITDLTTAYNKTDSLISPELVFGIPGHTSAEQTDKIAVTASQSGASDDTNPEDSEDKNEAAAIQVGSFSVMENAEDLQKSVISAGWEADIKPKTVNGKEYFTVTVPLAENQQIQNLIIELKEKGFEGYPVY